MIKRLFLFACLAFILATSCALAQDARGAILGRVADPTGAIVPNAEVKVTLIWGKGAADRKSVTIPRLTAAYRKFQVEFTPQASTEDAHLEITGTGSGSFHVGAVSLMPADNVEGFRKEVVAALKQLRFGVLRFPGGNFVSSYEWRDAVGDIDKRPPIFDPVWHAVQPNDVGTDEFMTLCRLLGVDPYITVNAGFGDAWSARELVEYTNGATTTAMGKWRAQAVIVEPAGLTYDGRVRIAELAKNGGLPSFYSLPWNVDAGGLLSYGPVQSQFRVRAAEYIDRILRGARPADLPVETPNMLEVVVNMRTAKALGVTIPRTIIPDRVIE